MLEDKYTLLYKKVIEYQQPLKFFTLHHNKIIYIKDIINYPINNFDATDLIFNYFESLVDNNILNKYISLIDRGIKRPSIDTDDLTEYTVADLTKYPKFKNLKGDVIYYDGDINLLLADKNVTPKTILNYIITEDQFNLLKYEGELITDDIINSINNYKEQFDNYDGIYFDTNSLFTKYYEWLNTNKDILTKDLSTADKIVEIQNYLLLNYVDILSSDINYNSLTKIFQPTLLNRDIDIYDGLDLFNSIVLNAHFYFMTYKNPNNTYYKIHDFTNYINISEINNNTINIQSKLHKINYNLASNKLEINYEDFRQEEDFKFLNIDIGEVVDYKIDGLFYLYNLQIDESKLLSLILNHPLLNLIFFVDDNIKYITKPYYTLKYIPYNSDHVITIKITQSFYTEEKIITTNNKKIKLDKDTPYLLIKFKNVYNTDSFINSLKLLLSKATTNKTTDLNNLLFKISFKKDKDKDINLTKLQNLAPDVFIEGYAGFCNKNKRPSPIPKKDIQSYINNKIKDLDLKGKDKSDFKEYGVLDFETKNSVLHLICDYDKDIYPYLKSTKVNPKLNNLPCCGAKPPKTEKVQKSTHITTYDVVLSNNSTGELKENVAYFLKNYKLNSEQFKRLGVPNDPNSLLHCIFIATNNKLYSNSKDKSYFVQQFKTTILDKVNINVVKQECYDISIDKIKTDFMNTDFLDPRLYYRIVEEYFNLNIYLFNQDILVIPRFLNFYCRTLNKNRPTVLIYTHQNQCELITTDEYLFSQDMALYCHQFLHYLLTTYTFNNSIIKNLYYYPDHLSYFKDATLVEQYIDTSGKMRALVFDKKLSLITIPSQPENLPTTTKIVRCDIKEVFKIMTQEPVAISKKGDLITGLWYRIFDLEEGEYIPVIPTNYNIDKPVIDAPAISIDTTINQFNYLVIKKQLHLLLSVLYWLYTVGLHQFRLFDNIEDFFNNYITINITDYNLLFTVKRRFPIFNYYEDYFNYLPITKDNKLILDKSIYTAVKNKLFYYTLLDKNSIPVVINNYYNYVDDFDYIPKNLIFLKQEHLQLWLHQKKLLNYTVSDSIYPYLYQFENNQIFIIQFADTLLSALNIIDYWLKFKVNKGKYIKNVDLNIKPAIYRVDENKKLVLAEQGNTNYLVLDYMYIPNKVGEYAAMLNLY